MKRLLVASMLAGASLGLLHSQARAGGLEYAGGSAQSLGRGGASTARANTPMVLAWNPAGLAELRGSQFLFDLNLALLDACVDPVGYYGWGAYNGGTRTILDDSEGNTQEFDLGNADKAAMQGTPENRFYTDPYDRVCMDQNITPIPQIAWTRRINDWFGMGFGLIFPAIQPAGRWGGRNGVIRGDDGDLRLAATRYMLLQSNNLGIFPNLGFGFKPFEALRFGFSLEWGIIAVNNFTMVAAGGGTSPAQDIIAHVKAQDWFIPALTASVHLVPIDALDVVFALRMQDDLDATGDIDLTTGIFNPNNQPHTTGDLTITRLVQHMPWKLTAGIRYADRFAPRPVGTGRHEADPAYPEVIHDPMNDESWDVEIDVEYQMNSRNDMQVLTYAGGRFVEFQPRMPGAAPGMIAFPNPNDPTTEIEKYWKDQLSIRAGSTVNVVPGLFSVSGGAHYETRGVTPEYMQIDFWPVERIGLHAGVTFRIHKAIDFSVSYAHIFQETITVSAPPQENAARIYECAYPSPTMPPMGCTVPPGQIRQIDRTTGAPGGRGQMGTEQVLNEPPTTGAQGEARLDQNLTNTSPPAPPWVINAGRYSSNFNIIAAGVNVHF